MAKRKKTQIAKEIANAIGAAGKPGHPWCEGVIEEGESGLAISDACPIRLPMRPADVRKLAEVAAQAPYGKGTQTIVDTGVRDTLEIDGGQVELSPEFLEAIHIAGRNIADELQLDADRLQFDLYKLLIYPKGGFFLPHRDSEKRIGMVATMIVVLPSKFGGGDLLIRHGGRQEAFSFPKARAQKQSQYVAFFADCEHEVAKVTSGVRVCLAFNLILKPKRKGSKRGSDPAVDAALLSQVRNWFQHRASDPLVFALEHQYTEAGLKPGYLKGADKELHRSVATVAESLGSRLYFGQVERHLCQFADDGSFGYSRRGNRRWSGDYDDLTIGESYEDEIVIDGWRDADGELAALAPLGCDSSQLISLIPAEDWVPTRQYYEGYTGNAGNTLDRWYHKSVIVIWPESEHFEIVTQMGLNFAVAELLERRASLHQCDDDELEQACDNCQKLAECTIERWPDRKYEQNAPGPDSQTWLKQFAAELPRLEELSLIDRFLEVISMRDWRVDLDQFVMNSLRCFGADSILPLLHRLVECEPPPNQYGIRFLEGLARRDAKWLLKVAKDKKHGGLSRDQLHGLLSSAAAKLSAHSKKLVEARHRRGDPPTDCWRVLTQAIIAAQADCFDDMIGLQDSCPSVFEFRSFQVPAAVKLRQFALKQHDEMPGALADWIERLKVRLVDATSGEPQPPSDFRRDSKVGCECKYCLQLSQFLADPTMHQTQIPASEHNRSHMEHVINSQRLDVQTKTIRSGSPYSLGLTKTLASHDAAVKQYHSDLKLLSTLQ
ncbi:2OG-Fe(II) oxygenase [Stieleria varia]|uniref:Fe2OG dioxygenase domain-containing protein n=1 Tax=Stieleria varia TaxID=2528005 RepID=A0A5C6ASC6_9BACT|nr:2OG-Fe(II) oxygenase [Stieleria varia]TWU02895.1 hypothetical protein Pla52n_39830 [Stieleria varia]